MLTTPLFWSVNFLDDRNTFQNQLLPNIIQTRELLKNNELNNVIIRSNNHTIYLLLYGIIL